MTMRDEAVAFVKEGFEAGKWTTRADCYKLIEEHEGLEEALAEGLEAFGANPDGPGGGAKGMASDAVSERRPKAILV